MVIKTCPHCGGTASLNSNYSYRTQRHYIYVKCDVCGAQGKTYNSTEDPREESWSTIACTDAINAWNMRTGGRD